MKTQQLPTALCGGTIRHLCVVFGVLCTLVGSSQGATYWLLSHEAPLNSLPLGSGTLTPTVDPGNIQTLSVAVQFTSSEVNDALTNGGFDSSTGLLTLGVLASNVTGGIAPTMAFSFDVPTFTGAETGANTLPFFGAGDPFDSVTGASAPFTYTWDQGIAVPNGNPLTVLLSGTLPPSAVSSGGYRVDGANLDAIAAVPEPSAALLGAIGALALLRRRR